MTLSNTKPLDYGKSCIHHVDYDRECPVESIRVPAPTKQRPYRKVLTTSCADCVAEDCDRFFECASKLALVHPECNKAISKNDDTPMLHLMDGVVLSVK